MAVWVDESYVAKDVEAKCGKCGETWHVIVAVAGGKIARVECKQCGGLHNYRPIVKDRQTLSKNTRTAVAMAAPVDAKPVKRQPKTKVLVPTVAANQNEIRKYSISEKDFAIGDRIEHKKFGVGVVEEIPEQGKMRVCFETARVLLVFGR
ncbi:MAG: hypothetical protein WC966_07075 [Bradymonadales bacterium]